MSDVDRNDPDNRNDMVEHGHDQHEGHPHGHESHEAIGVVALPELADALLEDLPNHPAGRAAKTILSGTVMRATMIALGEGVEMAEHDSPPAATLYVVRGDVTLKSGSRSWRLTAGQLAPIPPERHGVVAHADSAILLTVALR
ncbi:MAG TPA: LuxR family transcriptional regulator [Nocardioidaceae bacterium]|nr:LuxR family transcriptional regulator [Nocardioidaceae bacterium]